MNKLRLEQFLKPFMPEIEIWIEFYDHTYNTWRRERATTVHYALDENHDGRAILKADMYQHKP